MIVLRQILTYFVNRAPNLLAYFVGSSVLFSSCIFANHWDNTSCSAVKTRLHTERRSVTLTSKVTGSARPCCVCPSVCRRLTSLSGSRRRACRGPEWQQLPTRGTWGSRRLYRLRPPVERHTSCLAGRRWSTQELYKRHNSHGSPSPTNQDANPLPWPFL